MEGKSIIANKSYQFALEIIKVYKHLTVDYREFILFKQLLRSCTSIGADINEGLSAESKRDFIHKLNISLKESRETLYWLNLLKNREYLPIKAFLRLSF